MRDIIIQLEVQVGLASRERAAAEARERAAGLALEQARTKAAGAAQRRAELASVLEAATVQVDAACSRLGEARAAAAASAREVATLADSVAEGGADTKALLRVQDLAATQAAIAEAHQRRAAAAETARVAAETALTEHDIAEAGRVGLQLERLLVAEAELVDQRLREAVEHALAVGTVFDERRSFCPAEPWPAPLTNARARHSHLTGAFLLAAAPIDPAAATLAHDRGKPLAAIARAACECWGQGRGEGPDRPLPPGGTSAPVPAPVAGDGHDELDSLNEAA